MIRKPHPTDQSYIAATWTNSLALADRDTDRGRLGEAVDRVLDAPETRILVACDPNAPAEIWGWIAYSENPRVRTLFYVYVRDRRRGDGLAVQLFDRAFGPVGDGVTDDTATIRAMGRPLVYTFRGPSAARLLAKNPGAMYVPDYLGNTGK